MKIRYYYENGTVKEHTKFVGKRTINNEKGESTRVNIYKVHTIYETEEKEEYITTLSI